MHTSLALSSTAKQLGNLLRDTWSLRTVVRALEDFTPTDSFTQKKRGPSEFSAPQPESLAKNSNNKKPKTILDYCMSPDRFWAQRGLYACRQTFGFARDAQSFRILQFRLYSLHFHHRSLPSFLWGRRNRWRETDREREREKIDLHIGHERRG